MKYLILLERHSELPHFPFPVFYGNLNLPLSFLQKQRELDRVIVNYIQLRMAFNYLLPDFYQNTGLMGGGVMGDHQLSSSEELETNKPTS